MAIEVDRDGKVIVRAPYKTPERKIEEFLEKEEKWIEKSVKKALDRKLSHPEPTAEEKERLIAAAKAYLPQKTEEFSLMTGLKYTGVKITGAKTRFGSCNANNSICYSWRLMQYPTEAVDYVVMHELAHTAHHNHGKRFWATVERFMPDWKRRRAMLKK